jgi:hypothetical protein
VAQMRAMGAALATLSRGERATRGSERGEGVRS